MKTRIMLGKCCCGTVEPVEYGGEVYQINDPAGTCSLTIDPTFGCTLGNSSGVRTWFGLRVPSVAIANGATIAAASVGLSVTRVVGKPLSELVTVEYWNASDFAATTANFCSGGSWVTLGTRTLTAGAGVSELECQAAIAAITSLGGWSSGNAIGFRISPAWTVSGTEDKFTNITDTAGVGLNEWTLTVT